MDGSVALWFPIQTFYDRRARFKLNDVGKKECFKNVEYTFTMINTLYVRTGSY